MILPHPNYPNNPLCKILAGFDTGSDALPQDVREWLDTKVALALQRGDWIYLRGMASNSGNADQNMDLSNRRAHRVAYHLIQKPGVDASHITRVDAIGIGFSGGNRNDNSPRFRAVELIISPQRLPRMPRPPELTPREPSAFQRGEVGAEIPLDRLGLRSRAEFKIPVRGAIDYGNFRYKFSVHLIGVYELQGAGIPLNISGERRVTNDPTGRSNSFDVRGAFEHEFDGLRLVIEGKLGTSTYRKVRDAIGSGKGIKKVAREFFDGWGPRFQTEMGTIGPVQNDVAAGLILDDDCCCMELRSIFTFVVNLGDGEVAAQVELRTRVGLSTAGWRDTVAYTARHSNGFATFVRRLRTTFQQLITAGARTARSAASAIGQTAMRTSRSGAGAASRAATIAAEQSVAAARTSGRAALRLARFMAPHAARLGRFVCAGLEFASPWLLAIDLAILTRDVVLFICERARIEGFRQGRNLSFGTGFTFPIFGYGDLPNQPDESEAKRAALQLISEGHREQVQAILLLQFGWGMTGVDSYDDARTLGERVGMYLRSHDNVQSFLQDIRRSLRFF